jgi:hypothetical protein
MERLSGSNARGRRAKFTLRLNGREKTMTGTNTAAFGIYAAREHLEEAVSALRAEGFRATDISVLFPYNVGSKDFAVEKGTKAPEAAVTGASTGAVLGATLGWLAGIGTLAIPGFGPLLAAGPLVAALAGIGAGGAVGGVTGALVGMGMPEYEAKRYDGRLRNGGILLSVHCDSAEWARKGEMSPVPAKATRTTPAPLNPCHARGACRS